MLRRLPIKVIVDTVKASGQISVQLGAARHLAGWKARSKDELAKVPVMVGARLVDLSRAEGRTDVTDALETALVKAHR